MTNFDHASVVDRWLQDNSEGLSRAKISASVIAGYAHGSTCLRLESQSAIGEACLWESGETELQCSQVAVDGESWHKSTAVMENEEWNHALDFIFQWICTH